MRIAFVNANHFWSGVNSWMIGFGALLQQNGHIVRVYGRTDIFIKAAKKTIGHGEQCSFGCDFNPKSVAQFVHRFRRERIDIVIINTSKTLATAGIAAKLLGIPVIQRIGLPTDMPFRRRLAFLHRWIKPIFLCPCQFIADGFIAHLPYLKDFTVKVALNGKNPTVHPLTIHSPRRIVTTQRLETMKKHAVLFHALAQIDQPYELHIVGSGKEEDILKKLSQELGIADKIIWYGFTTDVPSILREMDIFLLGSTTEGLPNTQLEAMAHGLLPIVRHVGGVKEVTTPELNRWVLPFEATAQDFAEVISTALHLSDSELLDERTKSRQACRDIFDINVKVKEVEAWLQKIVSEAKKTHA